MSRPENQRCHACAFWNWSRATNRDGYPIGTCRRNAPIATNFAAGQAAATYWPETANHDWCGQFQMTDDPERWERLGT